MRNYFELKGKVALVTGASSGLGVQFAKALASQGADIIIAARRLERLEQVKKDVEELGVKCLAVKCDVGKVADVVAMVEKAKSQFGKIDILVNNAGVAGFAPADMQTDKEWLHIIDINLNALYYVTREVGKLMLEKGYGRVINIGSVASVMAVKGTPLSAYNASKGAVEMLTKSLASEWATRNITVNCIGPGYFMSEMTENIMDSPEFGTTIKTYCPMERPGGEGELDTALLFFASELSAYVTGQMLCVDGGMTAI